MTAWSNAQNLVTNDVALSHPKDSCEVLMFTNASDNHWGSLLTQIPTAEKGVEVGKMSHEPLGFLSGTFRDSQQRWTTVSPLGVLVVGECASTLTTANWLTFSNPSRALRRFQRLLLLFLTFSALVANPKTKCFTRSFGEKKNRAVHPHV